MKYWVLAYYHIVPIGDPEKEMAVQKEFCARYDLTGRVYIATHGINGQMSGTEEAASAYMEWMKQREPFAGCAFKVHYWDEHCFPRMQIKVKKSVVATDQQINWEGRGQPLDAKEWKSFLEQENPPPILDIRNDYEWEIGHFAGAKRPPCSNFRDFTAYAAQLETELNKDEPVLMYCTGGIRCELFSSMLKEKGFQKVYQLDGGVINWGLKEGTNHWEGKLFVFDDRMAVPLADPACPISHCHHCGKPSDRYFNCANMDCNELFLSCPECLQELKGCCSTSCQHAKRVRPVDHQKPNKPFRKWYNYPLTV